MPLRMEVDAQSIIGLNNHVKDLRNRLLEAADDEAEFFTEDLKVKYLSGGGGNFLSSSSVINVRSGNLRRRTVRLRARFIEGGDAILFGSVSRTKYARVLIGPRGQETTITPKSAQYLAIPLDAAKTAAGVGRATSPRSFANTFVARSKAGNLIIFQKGSDGQITPLFTLKEFVKIRSRVHPEEVARRARPRILRRFKAVVEGKRI